MKIDNLIKLANEFEKGNIPRELAAVMQKQHQNEREGHQSQITKENFEEFLEGKDLIMIEREKIKEEIKYHEDKLKELEEESIRRVKEYKEQRDLKRKNIYGDSAQQTPTESKFYRDFLILVEKKKFNHEFIIKKLNKQLEDFNDLFSKYLRGRDYLHPFYLY